LLFEERDEIRESNNLIRSLKNIKPENHENEVIYENLCDFIGSASLDPRLQLQG
jgi:hypothetical protein